MRCLFLFIFVCGFAAVAVVLLLLTSEIVYYSRELSVQ